MLFREKIEPRCAYCTHGTELDPKQVACVRQGVVPSVFSCRRFRYDPFKRLPPKPSVLNTKSFKKEDFTL